MVYESNYYSKNQANSQIVNLNSYFLEIFSNESLICVNKTIFFGVSIELSVISSDFLFSVLKNFTIIKIVNPTIKKSTRVLINKP